MKKLFLILLFFFPVLIGMPGCQKPKGNSDSNAETHSAPEKAETDKRKLATGAEQINQYLKLLEKKR